MDVRSVSDRFGYGNAIPTRTLEGSDGRTLLPTPAANVSSHATVLLRGLGLGHQAIRPPDVQANPGREDQAAGHQRDRTTAPDHAIDPNRDADDFLNTISWAMGHAAEVCIAYGLSPQEAADRMWFCVEALR